MIGHQTHLKENEDLPLLDSPLIEARRAKKKFLETAPPPPLSQGLDDRPALRVWMVWIRH